MQRDFEKIYLSGKNGPLPVGKFKISEVGLGWKNATSGQIVTISASDIEKVGCMKVAREYQLKVTKKGGNVFKFDGFLKEQIDGLKSLIDQFYKKALQITDPSYRGYNWGSLDFQATQLSFNVHGKQAFEIPLTDVINSQVASKTEVSLEMMQLKERCSEDTLVEMRFYVPGNVIQGQIRDNGTTKVYRDKEQTKDEEEDGDEDQEKGEISQSAYLDSHGDPMTAAAMLCQTIKQKSNSDVGLAELVTSFDELLLLTPRGKFKVDMHPAYFRLRGKSHDYKIFYTSITRLFSVPKPDDLHHIFVIGIHPPLRQGQTRYPYLVLQFEREEEIELTLNLTEEELTASEGRLVKSYDGPTCEVVPEIFHGLSKKKVLLPSSYRSSQGLSGLKCSQKAIEAILYPLDKGFLSIQKPPVFFSLAEISNVLFSRVSTAVGTTKTFEVKFTLTTGNDYVFSSLAREEFPMLELFCLEKKLNVRSEVEDQGISYKEQIEVEESEDDEDFVDKGSVSGDDVNEEFNEDYSSAEEGSEKRQRESSEVDEDEEEEEIVIKEPTATKKKSQKKKKEGPKRALTSYLYFCSAKRAQVKAENPSLSMMEMSKELGAMWKVCGDKSPYEMQAEQDKMRYADELKEFNRIGVLSSANISVPKLSAAKEMLSEQFVKSDSE